MFILFPKNKVSEVQRKQMTTFQASNVTNISVKGNFDDCQKLVKDLFNRNSKSLEYNFAAINSINWVRILGQIIYYFWSYLKVEKNMIPINYVVPTGNFGNVYAGFISKRMGLPIKKLIVCSNKNDILTRFFSNGVMKKKVARESLSPSMDIQVSSNFERLLFQIYDNNSEKIIEIMEDIKNNEFNLDDIALKKIQKDFLSESLNEKEILDIIKKVYKNYKVVIDPHTAIGVGAVKKMKKKNFVVLATAHPCKFPNAIFKSIEKKVDLPNHLKGILNQKEEYEVFQNDLESLKSYIKDNCK